MFDIAMNSDLHVHGMRRVGMCDGIIACVNVLRTGAKTPGELADFDASQGETAAQALKQVN